MHRDPKRSSTIRGGRKLFLGTASKRIFVEQFSMTNWKSGLRFVGAADRPPLLLRVKLDMYTQLNDLPGQFSKSEMA
jgi:hypothetical protein